MFYLELMSTRAIRTSATARTTTTCIGREGNVGTAAIGGTAIGYTVEDAGAAADGDTALQRGLRGSADDHCIAAAGRGLKGDGLAADGHSIPSVLVPRRGLIA